MKVILAFLISLPVYSNVFELAETGARFTLSITPQSIIYDSVALHEKVIVKKCNENLVTSLNAEILAKLPNENLNKGLNFKIDKNSLLVNPKSELGKIILAMDHRILRLLIEEKSACK